MLRLRQLLTGNGEPAPVVTRHDGYLIEIDDDALDLHRFDSLAQRGKAASASGDHAQAAVLLDRALRLWRGEALQGVLSETLHRDVAPALEERRLLAVESRIDAELALGRHAEVVSELAELTARHRVVMPSGDIGYLVSRYDDVARVLSDPAFSRPGCSAREFPGSPRLSSGHRTP